MSQQTTNRYFDELASGLARGSITRGKALRLMGAALLGGTLASLGIGEAAADPPGCKRIGKRCKNISQCCTRKCEGGICACIPDGDETPCADDSQCCSGNCVNETCAPLCPAPPACTDTCPCASGQTCLNGSCCPTDQVCGSTCGCPSGQGACQDGTCVPGHQFVCDCNDSTTQAACLPTECSAANAFAVGARLCEDHGGTNPTGQCFCAFAFC